MRQLLKTEGLSEAVEVDSAGTGDWHVGEAPDARSRAAAKRRGIDVKGRARQFTIEDYPRFDYVVAMDRHNLRDLRRLAPDDDSRRRVVLFRDFDPDGSTGLDVPDPYYGEGDGFETVLNICAHAGRGLLDRIRRDHHL